MSNINHSIKRVGLAVLTAGVLGFGTVSPAQAAPITDFDTLTQHDIEQSYYHDWNRNPKFRASVRQLFVRSKVAQPAWVRHGAGPSAPSRVVSHNGGNWVLLNTCKMHDCGDNNLVILFHPPTRDIYGMAQLNKKTVWLGKPNPAQKALLDSK